jgi:hypothetical protein
MEDIKENDEIINDQEPLLKPKRKMKKLPRSDKQQEAFTKAMKKRAENVELRKQQKKIEAAKLLLAVTKQAKKEPEQEEEEKSKPKKKSEKKVAPKSDSDLNTDDDSDDTEEDDADDYNEMYKQYVLSKASVKSKPKAKVVLKAKPKVKKVYILKKDIEEEDDDDSEYEQVVTKPKFKSQQNKKSAIKVTENHNYKQTPKNYFCD